MIRNFFLFLFVLFFLPQQLLAGDTKEFITLHFPQSVIAETLQRVLPLTFDGLSDRMEGTITVSKISDLKLLDNTLFCHIDLSGKNLNLITQVASQTLRLQLGSAQVDFDCEAKIRYDAQKRKVFIRPVAKNIDGEQAIRQGDVGQALLLFLNGREFGFELQELEPLLAEASNKNIFISTTILDIQVVEGALQLYLAPQIHVVPKAG